MRVDDMNVWDCAEQFTFPQAAALIAGIDPTRADLTPHERAKVSLVERRLRGEASKANARAFLMTQGEVGDLVPPVGILSNETIAEARAGGASEFAPQPLESASRAEIAVWLRRTMIRSHYMFELKPAEPSWTVRLPAPHAAIPYGTVARLIADQVEPESVSAVMAWRCKLVTGETGPNHLQARFRGGQPIPAGTLIGGLNGMQDAYVRSDELGQWLVVERYSVVHDPVEAIAPARLSARAAEINALETERGSTLSRLPSDEVEDAHRSRRCVSSTPPPEAGKRVQRGGAVSKAKGDLNEARHRRNREAKNEAVTYAKGLICAAIKKGTPYRTMSDVYRAVADKPILKDTQDSIKGDFTVQTIERWLRREKVTLGVEDPPSPSGEPDKRSAGASPHGG